MPDNDLNVRFGGDLSGLNASIAQAKSNLAAFSPQTTNQAKAGIDALNASFRDTRAASDTASSGWRENIATLADLTIVVRGAYDAMDYFAGHLVPSSQSIEGAKTIYGAVATSVSTLNGAYDAAAGSVSRFFTSAAYAERNTRLYEQANEGLRASIGRTIVEMDRATDRLGLYYSGIARVELEAISAAGGLDRFIESVNRTGGVGSMKETLVGFTAELMKIPGTSQEAAASIEVMLATIPNYSTESNKILVNLIQSISRTGDEALANAKKIGAAFRDQSNGGQILGDLTASLKNLDDIQVLATRISSSLQPAQASAYFDTIIAKLRQQSATQQVIVDQNDAALQKTPLIGGALKNVVEYATGAADKQREFANAVTVATANLELQKRAFDGILAAQQREIEFQKVLNDETTRVSQLEQAQSNIATLKSRLPSNTTAPTSSETDLITRTLIGEAGNQSDAGMQAVLNVIKNRVSTGYGGAESFSDVINAPRQFSVWNPGDAAGAMAKSVSTDSDVYQRALALVQQMKAGNLDDNTGGATSYYNPSQASPSWGPTMTNQTTIGAHLFGNTPQSPPVATDPDQVEKINQRLQEQADKIREINNAKAGGTVADQASLAIATENAVAAKNEVADAQKLLEAKRQDRANAEGGSPSALLAADRAVADAEQSLRDKSVAAEKSAADLKAAAYREGSRQRMQILNDELTKEQAQYVQGSARWNDLERQKVMNLRQYQDAQRTSTLDTENAKFDAQRRGFSEEQELIKARAQLVGAMQAEDYAQLADVLARQAAAERAHYTTLQQLYADDPKQYAKYAMLKTQVDAQEHARQLQNTLAFQQQLVQTYRSAFEQVGSTISSTLMQIIQGQATFKDLMRNVVLNIIQQFIEARIKIVADWLAGQAAQVAATVTGEGAKTAATATGSAARTDLLGVATAIQTAQIAIGVVRSILASAAQTFAGIFGFLAPIMGPAAVGPAAAGQATVAAVAGSIPSFDVGAWRLPADTIAQVHAGEMIVPASPAAALRAALEGGSGANRGGGGQPVTFNVTAVDGAGVKRFFGANSRAIVGALNDAVKNGTHLGFAKIGR